MKWMEDFIKPGLIPTNYYDKAYAPLEKVDSPQTFLGPDRQNPHRRIHE